MTEAFAALSNVSAAAILRGQYPFIPTEKLLLLVGKVSAECDKLVKAGFARPTRATVSMRDSGGTELEMGTVTIDGINIERGEHAIPGTIMLSFVVGK